MSKLKEMTAEELTAEIGDLKQALFKLRVSKAIGRLEKPHKMKQLRRDLARAMTFLRERQVGKGARK